MIYITGDCHRDFTRFSKKNFPEQEEMTAPQWYQKKELNQKRKMSRKERIRKKRSRQRNRRNNRKTQRRS